MATAEEWADAILLGAVRIAPDSILRAVLAANERCSSQGMGVEHLPQPPRPVPNWTPWSRGGEQWHTGVNEYIWYVTNHWSHSKGHIAELFRHGRVVKSSPPFDTHAQAVAWAEREPLDPIKKAPPPKTAWARILEDD
jgi:hypothetical protein